LSSLSLELAFHFMNLALHLILGAFFRHFKFLLFKPWCAGKRA
jgi:hypothetical protein